MRSILTVTSAASSYDLTTLANVKDELSVTDGSSDTVLSRYITSASAAASQWCNRVFAVETVSEEFLPEQRATIFNSAKVNPLQLTRWPVISITSVTEDGTLLVAGTDYIADNEIGQLTRLNSSGLPQQWIPRVITVVYSAGYATTPADLEDAIIRLVTKRYSSKGRDATVRQENLPGVMEQSFWIATGTDAGNLPPDIADILDNYRMPVSV